MSHRPDTETELHGTPVLEPLPAAQPIDGALRRLSRSANKGRLWLGLAAVGVAVPGRVRRAALRGAGSLAVTSFLVNVVLKPMIGRRRPEEHRVPLHRRLAKEPKTTSFPSGHAASAAAFATGVLMEHRGLGAAVLPVAAAVGYSRVHVGVHYPGDVVAGIAVGAGVAIGTQRWWPVRPMHPARAREINAAPALPKGNGLVIAVNPRSGPDDNDPVAELRELLPEAELIVLEDGVDLVEELTKASDRAQALGIAGGDGTVGTAARVALEQGLPLAVIPSGTLNHFARDVGVESTSDAARAVEAGEAVAVDVAVAAGTPFLNTASIGGYPDMVRLRDKFAKRLGHWGGLSKWVGMALAAARVLRRQKPLRLEVNGVPTTCWIVFVGNCRYTPRGLSPAWRPSLNDELLDVQYLRADVKFARTRAVIATLGGYVERSHVYGELTVTKLRVESLDGPVRIARDGEPGEPLESIDFDKLPGTLIVYRPH